MKPSGKPLLAALGIAGLIAVTMGKAQAAQTQGVALQFNPQAMSSRGIAFLKGEEGFSATAYKDGVRLGVQLYSIGYGHQLVPGDGLTKNSVITAERAEQLLRGDLVSREKVVRDSLRRSDGTATPVTQSQFDALVSLAYNIGNGAYAGSTVAKRMRLGDFVGARAAWDDWNKSAGEVHPVLVGRRQRELNLFAT